MIRDRPGSASGVQRSFDCLKDGDEPEKNVSACEQGRQSISGSARPLPSGLRADNPFLQVQIASAPFVRFASTETPADTRSPTRIVGRHSGPKKTSTREPNLM